MRRPQATFYSLLVFVLAGCSSGSGSGADDDAPDTSADTADVTTDITADVDDASGDADSDDASDLGAPDGQDTADATDMGDQRLEWSVFDDGPYSVGFRSIELTYTPRGYDEDRSLRASIWYPTDASSGSPARYQGLFSRNEVFTDAEPSDGGPFPLFVFSHGNMSFAEQNFFTTEFLASHGWVVIAPDHAGNSTFDGVDDRDDIALLRPLDITAVLDAIYGLPEGDVLVGALTDEVVLSGHSYGGYTTLAVAGTGFDVDAFVNACEGTARDSEFCEVLQNPDRLQLLRDGFLDERVDLAIPLTPGIQEYFGDGPADIDIPVLVMTGALDLTLPNSTQGDPIWEALDGDDDVRLDFVNAGHFTFSNMCDTLPGFIEDDGCGDGFIDAPLAQELINAYTLGFARYHLWDDESVAGLIQGTETPAPDEIEFSTH